MEEKGNVAKVQKVTGFYTFKIEGYSGLSIKVGDSVESPEFFICGHLWQLRIFPGGSLDTHKGYISFYLASKSTKVARASYKLTVVSQIIGGDDESFASSGVRVFEAKGVQVDGWGRDKFMLNTMLNDPEFGFCVDDSVIFKVEITVCGDLENCPNNSLVLDSNEVYKQSSINSSLRQILLQSIETDCCFLVGPNKERIQAHRCILVVRSAVFAAMFTNEMTEKSNGEIVIPDCDPLVVQEMLHYMYTDQLSSPFALDESAVPLLALSLKYQVVGLVDLCETHLASEICEETVLTMLKLADAWQAKKLKEKALHFIGRHPQKFEDKGILKDFSQEIDHDLVQEIQLIIESVKKRKGCKGVVEKERRFHTTCSIM